MMRAKADPKATSNLIYGLACVLMLGSIYVLLMPRPRPKQTKISTRREESTLRETRDSILKAQAAVGTRAWTGEDAAITGRILDMTTQLARTHNVSFVRLQPQRATLGVALEQLPYLLVVEGPFPNVAALERDLEVPANRLAVNAIQLASSDTESNKVSASIGIVAHRVGASAGKEEAPRGKRS